jgi:hypothetical protein
MSERLYFAIYAEGGGKPTALFAAIEDAIEWACERFGASTFRIKGCFVPMTKSDPHAGMNPWGEERLD